MIFKIDHTAGDTCGNEWIEGESEYLEAKSLEDAWKKLKKPYVHTYCIKNYWIYWENNPDFNWEKDMAEATGFKSGAFNGLQVTSIKVKK